jgi:DNA-binding NarL/FixJ family response regulator
MGPDGIGAAALWRYREGGIPRTRDTPWTGAMQNGPHPAEARMVTSVLIVEDEPEFLQRFSEAVLADAGLRLLGGVSTGRAGLALLDAQPPDVMLVDLGLPDIDGIELIRHAARHHAGCDVLVVTMFADDEHVIGSIEAGAAGYLLKDARAPRIAAAIHEVREGGSPISPSIARRVLARFRIAPSTPAASAPAPLQAEASPLSARETEILRLIAKGLSFDTVGELLGISPHTVVTHVKKIYRKLAVNSRGEAVYEAGQMGLL